MDADIDISRSLDIIAEEMSGKDAKTKLPFVIDYQKEDNQDISDSTVITLRQATRQWSELHDFNRRLFRIARTLIKYGDCFFRKTSDTKKWIYVDPSLVYGIEIDSEGNRIAYHIKQPGTGANQQFGRTEQLDIVPAAAMIHFSMSDDMGDSAPFGASVLRPIYRVYRQMAMIEDAVIIYRIVRAPERRVFYVDVGNMPPQRVKQYLEQIKNEIRQKRSPTQQGGKDTVDGAYDAQCLVMSTKIPLLDGRTLSIEELAKEHEEGKKNWTLSAHPVTGEIKPGEITWAGKTRKNAELVKVTLDNGEEIICTPDHKIPVLGEGFTQAADLKAGQSLISYCEKEKQISGSKSEYKHVFDHSSNSWVAMHTLVNKTVNGLFEAPAGQHAVSHHINFNRLDNSPSNLQWMGHKDHFKYHSSVAKESWAQLPDDLKKKRIANISIGARLGMAKLTPEFKKLMVEKYAPKVKLAYVRRKQNVAEWEEYLKKISIPRSEEFKQAQRARLSNDWASGKFRPFKNQSWNFSQACLAEFVAEAKRQDLNKEKTIAALNASTKFHKLLAEANPRDVSCCNFKIDLNGFSQKAQLRLFQHFNISSWKSFVEDVVPNYNHKVVSVEFLKERQDTGCITIGESLHDWHTFPTSAGIFVKNSLQEDIYMPVTAGGRGSKVETLPGGTEDFGSNLLKWFQDKIFRGLRIPTSYLGGAEGAGAQYNDGKVGIAYIEELRFANFIRRLQDRLTEVLDQEFKVYLKVVGLNIDDEVFKLNLPDPANFALYRQAALDADLISAFNNIEGTKYLSKRFILKRYLGLSDDEIQMNEVMIKEEHSIEDTSKVSALQQIYDEKVYGDRESITVEDEAPSGGGGEGSSDFFSGGEEPGAEETPEAPPEEEKGTKEAPPEEAA